MTAGPIKGVKRGHQLHVYFLFGINQGIQVMKKNNPKNFSKKNPVEGFRIVS